MIGKVKYGENDGHLVRYLVNGVTGGKEWSTIMSAAEIFAMMDLEMHKLTVIDVYRINGYGEALTDCQFLGRGILKNPKRMEIRSDYGIEASVQ